MPPIQLPLKTVTTYAEHRQRWQGCRACVLCETRKSVVLYRGDLPCEILFCAEAPGESEDVLGFPMKGPAGHLMDQIVKNGLPLGRTFGFTNLIACIPRDPEGGKLAKPDDDSVRACEGRLREIVNLAQPKLIVCVGREAQMWLNPGYKASIKLDRPIPMASIIHPAAILRGFERRLQGLEARRASVEIRDAVKKLDEGGYNATRTPREQLEQWNRECPRGQYVPKSDDEIPF